MKLIRRLNLYLKLPTILHICFEMPVLEGGNFLITSNKGQSFGLIHDLKKFVFPWFSPDFCQIFQIDRKAFKLLNERKRYFNLGLDP